MTDATTTDLIGRLRAASGPDRRLDIEIGLACGWTREEDWYVSWTRPDGRKIMALPWFTQSVDAALTLVPEGRMWFVGHLDPTDLRFCATITKIEGVCGETWRGIAATPAIAICIAALAARGKS